MPEVLTEATVREAFRIFTKDAEHPYSASAMREAIEFAMHRAAPKPEPAPLAGVVEAMRRSIDNCPGTCGYDGHALQSALSLQPAQQASSFQERVQPWMLECFGPEIAADKLERADRLIEEALELVQTGDYAKERAHALVDYVFDRDQGEIGQEVGGVMVTLAAFCLAHGIDMHEAGETELARIWTKVEQIRAKHAAKPTGSALPVAQQAPAEQAEVNRALEQRNEHLRAEQRLEQKLAGSSAENQRLKRELGYLKRHIRCGQCSWEIGHEPGCPMNGKGTDWFAGEVDADGNQLATVRVDKLKAIVDLIEGFPGYGTATNRDGRLKDQPAWVTFYNLVAALSSRGMKEE